VKRFFRLLIAAAFLAGGVIVYERFIRAPSADELERLRERRRALEAQLEGRVTSAWGSAPKSAVVVGVPPAFAQRFVADVLNTLVRDVRVALRNVEVRREGELHGRILIGRSTLGTFALHANLERVEGRLHPGTPRLTFGGDRVQVSLPVAMEEGTGQGRLDFHWDGRGVAGAVCGDVEMEGPIAGRVAPTSYTLEGAFQLSAEGATIVARPEFDDVKLSLAVEPSSETWQLVDDVIAKQNALCRKGLAMADVREKVRELVGKGIVVTLPRRLFPDVKFPAGMQAPLAEDVHGPRVRVSPTALKVTRSWLWYGADVRVETAPVREAPEVPETPEALAGEKRLP
jgi:hypothetical protein